jgi:hypothetical protein
MKSRLVTLPSLVAWVVLVIALTLPLSVRAEGSNVDGMRLADWEKNAHRIISGPLSAEALEQESLEALRKNPHASQTPFGHDNDKWERFKANRRPGEIFRVDHFYPGNYAGPQGGWRGLIGVRDGVIVESLVEIIYE